VVAGYISLLSCSLRRFMPAGAWSSRAFLPKREATNFSIGSSSCFLSAASGDNDALVGTTRCRWPAAVGEGCRHLQWIRYRLNDGQLEVSTNNKHAMDSSKALTSISDKDYLF
jgi:hypothetical protein